MELREKLLRNPKVPDALVDDVIHRAQALKDAETQRGEGASLQEIQAVAAELGIEPEHVADALGQLRGEAQDAKEQEAAEAALEAEKARVRQAQIKRFGAIGLAVFLAFGALFGGTAMVGRSQVLDAQATLGQAQAALEVQLDRQAALVPQLVVLAGGQSAELREAQDALGEAQTLEQRLAASQELSVSAAQALSGVETDEGTALNLQYELTGATNRITTEQRRYAEAEAAYQSATSGAAAQLAIGLGLAP
ncbi:MAG: hypothetical protein VX899_18565 [Myxococcota bacterium]|nr:hypothetical protein [Myxococcota bacterium]